MLHLSSALWVGHSNYEIPRENLSVGIIYLKCQSALWKVELAGHIHASPLLLFPLLTPPPCPLLLIPPLFFSLLFLLFSPIFFPFPFSPIVFAEIFNLWNISDILKGIVCQIADVSTTEINVFHSIQKRLTIFQH